MAYTLAPGPFATRHGMDSIDDGQMYGPRRHQVRHYARHAIPRVFRGTSIDHRGCTLRGQAIHFMKRPAAAPRGKTRFVLGSAIAVNCAGSDAEAVLHREGDAGGHVLFQ